MTVTCIIRKDNPDIPVELFADNRNAIDRFRELELTEQVTIFVTEL